MAVCVCVWVPFEVTQQQKEKDGGFFGILAGHKKNPVNSSV
jgi:hypothetical protein